MTDLTEKEIKDYFLAAARKGKLKDVEKFLSMGADINCQNIMKRYSALMQASKYGHRHVVQYLIACGADIELKSKNGDTALLIAARNGRPNIVKYLLEQGANMQANYSFDLTIVDIAKNPAKTFLVSYLEQKKLEEQFKDNNQCESILSF